MENVDGLKSLFEIAIILVVLTHWELYDWTLCYAQGVTWTKSAQKSELAFYKSEPKSTPKDHQKAHDSELKVSQENMMSQKVKKYTLK